MKDDELIAQIRDAYTPPPVDADRFDAALHARLAEPRRRGWIWGGLGATAALAAVIFLWMGGPQVASPTPDSAPQVASVTPPLAPSTAGVQTTLPAESTWLAALEYDAEATVEDLDGLPDEYDELADLLEL